MSTTDSHDPPGDETAAAMVGLAGEDAALRSLIERLGEEGVAIASGGNQPFPLDDRASVWLVVAGHVDVFSTRALPGGDFIERRHVTAATAGQLLFGLGRAVDAGDVALLAVAAANTRLRRLSLERLLAIAALPPWQSAVAAAIDAWLIALYDAVTGDRHPRNYQELQPGKPLVMSAGGAVRTERSPLWIQHLVGTTRLFGDPRLAPIGKGAVFPVAARGWLQAATPLKVTGLLTAAWLAADPTGAALAPFHEAMLACLVEKRREAADVDRDRLEARELADRAAAAGALARLASILDEDGVPAAAIEGRANPLHAAAWRVAHALGVVLAPPRALRKDQLVRDPLSNLTRDAGLRIRQVALRDAWWKHDHGPLVGYRASDKRPVALLPASPSSYELYDPTEGTREKVTEEVAQTLDPFAQTFYRRLAPRPLRTADLVRFGSFGGRKDLTLVALMGLAGGLLGLVTPLATGLLFDTIIPGAQRLQLLQLALGLAAAALANSAFEVTRGFAILRLEGKLGASVQAAIWDRLLDLPAGFFRDYSAGDLAQRAFGISVILKSLSASTVSALMASAFGLFNAGLLFYYDAQLATWGAALVLFAVAVTVVSGMRQLRLQRPLTSLQGRISGLVFELINGIAKLRIAGAEARAFALWARLFGEQRRLALRSRAPLVVFNAVYPVVATMAIYYALGTRAKSELSTGHFIAFIAAFTTFLLATLSACRSVLSLVSIGPTYERLRPILDTPPEIDQSKADPGELTGEIEVAHVSFRYRDDGPLILNDVSVRIRPGEFVAVVGPSGGGKSTFLRMLLGFEKPTQGTIYYNGQDLAGLDMREVRRQIGVVLQNGKLLSGDILTNIIGSSNLTKDDALEAARMAGFNKDLEAMPMGLHTVVSEGGSTLSGGQRQRLLIARAVVRKPRMLFFDEATSALDNRTQAIVSQSVERLAATRVVIAHRLSTILHADRILVLDGGRLVQSGTYAELIAQPGPFAELAKRQLA